MSKGWAGGSTRAWRQMRAEVLARDSERCQLQLDGCLTIADQVHHKLGKGVSERPEDLCAACQPCNLAIGDPTATDPDPTPRTQW